MSKELELTQDLSLWVKSDAVLPANVVPVTDQAKDDPSVLFQLLFGLYVANSTYGINPVNISQFKIETKNSEHEMTFALESGGDYDVFTLKTLHRVVLDYRKFGVNQNLDTLSIADAFSTLLDKTNAGKLLKNQLKIPKQDYGSGMEWGPNLALFHPFFAAYYTGEQTNAPPTGNDVFVFLNGHQPKWENIKDKNARRKKQEEIYAKGTAYTLDQFKDIIQSLLGIYKNLEELYPEGDDPIRFGLSEDLQTEYQSILTILNGNYTIDGLGKIPTFTTGTNMLVAYLPDKTLTPWVRGIIDYKRARGYVIILLSIIGKIVGNPIYSMSVDSTKEIEVMTAIENWGNFDPSTWEYDFKRVYGAYDDYFNSTENAKKAAAAKEEAERKAKEEAERKAKEERDEQEKNISDPVKEIGKGLKSQTIWDNVLKKDYTKSKDSALVTTEFKTLLNNPKDPIVISRAAAGEIALHLKYDDPARRKLLAFSQILI